MIAKETKTEWNLKAIKDFTFNLIINKYLEYFCLLPLLFAHGLCLLIGLGYKSSLTCFCVRLCFCEICVLTAV